MRTFKQHMNSVKHAMNAAYSSTKTLEIINATNISANSIAGSFPIGRLSEKITLSPGDRLPSNLAGIIAVRDSSDGSRMFERSEASVGDDEEVGRFYIDMEYEAASKTTLPFKSVGSITAGKNTLSCVDMISLSTGAVVYRRSTGDTAYQVSVDADGNIEFDADGKMVFLPMPADPDLVDVRFYESDEINNDEVVYHGENSTLAYWNHASYGWIVSELADVGGDPSGYFVIEDGDGTGTGDWDGLFISMEVIEESSVDAVSDDDYTDLIVCITNSTYGDFYYKVSSVNEDNTFNLNGTHPFDEEDSIVRIYTESTSLIRFVDFSEQEITSGTYDVFYWKFPNPMTQDSDIIPFAYPDYLELMTIRRMPETKDRRPVSKKELDEARSIAKKKEPVLKPRSKPLTTQGSVFGMGGQTSGAYTIRGE